MKQFNIFGEIDEMELVNDEFQIKKKTEEDDQLNINFNTEEEEDGSTKDRT